MTDIRSLLADHSQSDSIDALYFAVRAIKQAASLHLTGKDIFEDDPRSSPGDAARALTAKLVSAIEADAGKPAAAFSELEVMDALDKLTSAGRSLDGEYTQAEIEGADRFIRSLEAGTFQTQGHGSLAFMK